MSSPVKHFLDVLTRALRRAHHFALVEGSAIPTKARPLVISFQVRHSVRPMHLFGHKLDHDYYFELPGEGERDTQSFARCFTSHHRLFRAFPRANRILSIARNPIACASSSTNEPPVFAPSRPWRFSVLAASSGGSTCSAIPG